MHAMKHASTVPQKVVRFKPLYVQVTCRFNLFPSWMLLLVIPLPSTNSSSKNLEYGTIYRPRKAQYISPTIAST